MVGGLGGGGAEHEASGGHGSACRPLPHLVFVWEINGLMVLNSATSC